MCNELSSMGLATGRVCGIDLGRGYAINLISGGSAKFSCAIAHSLEMH